MFVRLDAKGIGKPGRRLRFGRLTGAAAAAGATVLAAATVAAAAGGTLDPTFGAAHNGTVLNTVGQNPLVTAVVRQADGKIVIGGGAADGAARKFALTRLNADGTPDGSYGTGGTVLTAVGDGNSDLAGGLALQSDGKVIVVGTATDHGHSDFALARYTTAGVLDPTFGHGGSVLTQFTAGNASAAAIAIQADGKILAAGAGPGSAGQGFAISRYGADGVLDPTFGTAGTAITTFGSGGQAAVSNLLVQGDGKILAAGSAADPNGLSAFALARYLPNGAPDTTFGTNGKAVTAVGSGQKAAIASVVELADGRIVAAGAAADSGQTKIALAGYTAAGAADPSFGAGGLALSLIGDGGLSAPSALLREADGKYILVGTALDHGLRKFAVGRYLPTGSIDTTFGYSGSVVTAIADAAVATAGVLQPDGKLVEVGSAVQGTGLKLAAARYDL